MSETLEAVDHGLPPWCARKPLASLFLPRGFALIALSDIANCFSCFPRPSRFCPALARQPRHASDCSGR